MYMLHVYFSGFNGWSSIVLSIVCYPFVSSALRKVCLHYLPTTKIQVQNVLSVIEGCQERVIGKKFPRKNIPGKKICVETKNLLLITIWI